MTDMRKEFALSVCIISALAVLTIGAIEAGSFASQVVLTGLAVALFFYHVNRRNIGFSIDAVLAQKSLAVGVVVAVPATTGLLPF